MDRVHLLSIAFTVLRCFPFNPQTLCCCCLPGEPQVVWELHWALKDRGSTDKDLLILHKYHYEVLEGAMEVTFQ